MKLKTLHQVSTRDIREGIDSGVHEKLGYLQMMIAKQGKDPQPIIAKIRAMVEPGFAKAEGYKNSFQRWVKGAKATDTKEGMAYGRKIRVTVLEAAAREMLTEGFFSDIGKAILAKLKDVIDDEPRESDAVRAALDTYDTKLGWILRYAQNTEELLYDDPKFWQKLDETTGGLGSKIKTFVEKQVERVQGMPESIRATATCLTECVIEEARISQVMLSLGLDQPTVQSIMGDSGLRDDDYDLARLRDAGQAVTGAITGAGQKVAGAAGALGSAIKGAATGAIAGAKAGWSGEQPGQAAAGVSAPAPAKPKTAQEIRQIKQANLVFANAVITTAYALLEMEKAKTEAPEQAKETMQAAAQELGVEGVAPVKPPENTANPPLKQKDNVVSTSDLQQYS